jgi:hypothetical protein
MHILISRYDRPKSGCFCYWQTASERTYDQCDDAVCDSSLVYKYQLNDRLRRACASRTFLTSSLGWRCGLIIIREGVRVHR